MKCRAAVIQGVGRDWEIREIELDPPRAGEVMVRMAVAGQKALQPDDIAHAVAALVTQSAGSFISEMHLRPTRKP